MGKSLILGTIVGGAIAFVWFMISWMIIPWHCATMNSFTDEAAVAQVIMENTEKDGVYVLPNMCGANDREMQTNKWKKGPVVFSAVQKYGDDMGAPTYIMGIITQLIGAFLITLIVIRTAGFWPKVFMTTLIGLSIGILSGLPNWNWWGFSFDFVLVGICDYTIAWFFAGLGIAAVVKR